MAPLLRLLAALCAALLLVLVPGAPPLAAADAVTVSGTVTDAGGAPLEGIVVTVSSPSLTVQATTGADGTYTTTPVPHGEYTVSFAQIDGPEPRRAVQYWPKVWSATQASPLVVDADSAASVGGIDASLELPATMSGTARDTEGAGLAGTCVTAWLLAGDTPHFLTDQMVEPDGSYLIPSLPPAPVQLQFRDCTPPLHHLSTQLDPVALVPGQVVTDLDVVLERGGSIRGTVRDESGSPLQDVCVAAQAADGPGDWSETSSTGADGTYEVTPLGAGTYDLSVAPCADQPYLEAFVGAVEVTAGVATGGVDVTLRRATTISGTVRDAEGAPVGEVCVQASDAGSVRGSDRTDDDGTYRVDLDGGGEVSLQFVDCREVPGLAGAVTTLELDDGEDRTGVDMSLAEGRAASISGTVTNVRGEPLEGICVVAYLAAETTRFGSTDAAGSYRIPAVGAGTWSVAFLNCPEDDGPDEDPAVVDPVSGVRWGPQWWGGAALVFSDAQSGPDPIADGADLVTLAPGDEAVVEHCFGCGVIDVAMRLDGSRVVAEVRSNALAAADPSAAQLSAAADWQYTLTCLATATTTSASTSAGVSSSGPELVLDGVDSGREQRCRVTATLDGVLVADSDEQVLGTEVVQPTGPGSATPDADGDGGGGRPLALVG